MSVLVFLLPFEAVQQWVLAVAALWRTLMLLTLMMMMTLLLLMMLMLMLLMLLMFMLLCVQIETRQALLNFQVTNAGRG